MRCTSSTICTICPRHPDGIQMVSIEYPYGMCRSYFDSKAAYLCSLAYVPHSRFSRVRRQMWAILVHVTHSACSVLSGGGQMLAVHGRKTVAALSRAIWARNGPDKPALKSRDCTGPACFSRFFGAGSISLVLQGDMSKRLHLHEP